MENEIKNCVRALKQGGLILYPTDTVWGIGCDATNFDAIEKIYKLKKRNDSKTMICLVSDFKMLQQYIEEIPEVAYDILKYAVKPTTLIYDRPKRVAENIIAEDNTLAIRVVRHKFCNQLIKKFGKPIVSTSANFSMQPTPNSFSEISQELINNVDYVVSIDRKRKSKKTSTIMRLQENGIINIIRK